MTAPMSNEQQRVDVARKYVLPTKPMTIVDAVNRMALATGGVRNAVIGGDADYNGHSVGIRWNPLRKNWTADYFWGGQVIIYRGADLAACLEAAKKFYEGEGRGASVEVEVENQADAAACEAAGYIAASSEDLSWRNWKFDEINYARSMERHGFRPNIADLIEAASLADFKARGNTRAALANVGAQA